jgi:alpha-tubulin suppressor-like RCC1 family protein
MVEPSPVELKALNDLYLDQINVGMNVCVGKSSSNRQVYCWGENHGDMIATDAKGDLPSPVPSGQADAAFAGWSCVWLVGDSENQISRWGPPTGFTTFVDAEPSEIKQIVSSVYHTAILKRNGEVYFRQDRDDAEYHAPIQKLPPIKTISRGWSNFLLLDQEGSVWSIGANKHGQCGVGTTDHLVKYVLSCQHVVCH